MAYGEAEGKLKSKRDPAGQSTRLSYHADPPSWVSLASTLSLWFYTFLTVVLAWTLSIVFIWSISL